MATNLENMLALVREKKIHFGQFVDGTRAEFRAMARSLTRRWAPPEWYTLEDVEQELYLGAWRHIWSFDETRGTSLVRYITWSAMYGAKRALHRARGAGLHGSPDKRPSRFERTLSSYGEGEEFVMTIVVDPAVAEEDLIAEEDRLNALDAALEACRSGEERAVVLAVREAGSLDAAGLFLYDDVDSRIDHRLGCEDAADRFVRRHARRVAERAAGFRQVDLTSG